MLRAAPATTRSPAPARAGLGFVVGTVAAPLIAAVADRDLIVAAVTSAAGALAGAAPCWARRRCQRANGRRARR